MIYNVTIAANEGDPISFQTGEGEDCKITSFEFKLDSLDDKSVERDRNARCQITLEGKIDEKSYEETLKLAKWSVQKSSIFRTVTVEVVDSNDDGDGTTYRTYKLDKMFVVDYIERFGGENQGQAGDQATFKLIMAQSANHGPNSIY